LAEGKRYPRGSVASVVVGILGLTVAQVFGPIWAIILGKRAEAEYRAKPEAYRGNLGRAGYLLGYAGLMATAGLIVWAITRRLL
jgi:hypothetical protein